MTQIDSRIKLKRTQTPGSEPTIGPSGDNRDGSWTALDIYDGELFYNSPDGRLWIGSPTGAREISLGSTAGASSLPLILDGINNIVPSFGTNGITNSTFSTIIGGDIGELSDSNGGTIIGGRTGGNPLNPLKHIIINSNGGTIIGGSINTMSTSGDAAMIGTSSATISNSYGGTIIGGYINNMDRAPSSTMLNAITSSITLSGSSLIAAGVNNHISGTDGVGSDSMYNVILSGSGCSILSNTSPTLYGNQYNTIIGGYDCILDDSIATSGIGNNLNISIGSARTDMAASTSGNVNTSSDISSVDSTFADAQICGIYNSESAIIRNSILSTITGSTNAQPSIINGFDCVHILGKGITADTSDTTYVQRLDVADGIQTDNATLKTKVIDIGDWDMDTVYGVSIAHGLTFTNIRNIDVLIRNDADTLYTTDFTGENIGKDADSTNINLTSLILGGFDNVNYNATSYNRGWITITYVA